MNTITSISVIKGPKLKDLDESREKLRLFKNRLYTLNELVENGFISNNLKEDVILLLGDFEKEKIHLNSNDLSLLKNLEKKVGNKIVDSILKKRE